MLAPTHGTLAVNGLCLHYIEQGSGAPILFLHGFPEYSGAWLDVMARLADRHRTIALDTRGINLSEGPAEIDGYRLDQLAEDVRQAIRALGYEKLTLVGHDWGGFIAWETAIRHPESLDRLVIVNTAHNGVFDGLLRQGGAQAAASKYMLAFRSERGEELLSRNDFAGFRRELIEPRRSTGSLAPAREAEYLALWHRRESLTAGLNYYRANKSGPPSGDDPPPRVLADTIVRVPTLVIWGDRDMYFTPENLDLLPAVVPDLTLRRYPENDHWIVHQRPDEVAELIAAFAAGKLAREETA
jgi:pimeloyl-ACP methyl ester carboxylesterase